MVCSTLHDRKLCLLKLLIVLHFHLARLDREAAEESKDSSLFLFLWLFLLALGHITMKFKTVKFQFLLLRGWPVIYKVPVSF